MWTPYENRSGRSGVESYELLDDGINVKFKSGGEYFYPTSSNSTSVMGDMHSMADHGEFLNRYINANQPVFTRGTRPAPTSNDTRALTENDNTKIQALTVKFLKRNPSIADQLRMAKWRRLQAAENFDQWKNIRKKG
jgi:hypothetical protein